MSSTLDSSLGSTSSESKSSERDDRKQQTVGEKPYHTKPGSLQHKVGVLADVSLQKLQSLVPESISHAKEKKVKSEEEEELEQVRAAGGPLPRRSSLGRVPSGFESPVATQRKMDFKLPSSTKQQEQQQHEPSFTEAARDVGEHVVESVSHAIHPAVEAIHRWVDPREDAANEAATGMHPSAPAEVLRALGRSAEQPATSSTVGALTSSASASSGPSSSTNRVSLSSTSTPSAPLKDADPVVQSSLESSRKVSGMDDEQKERRLHMAAAKEEAKSIM